MAKHFNLRHFIKTAPKKYKKQIIYGILAIIIILALIPPATYLYFAKDLKDKESIMNRGKTGLTLQDRDGKTFFTFYQPKEIKYIPLSQIPKSVQEAAIATEDKNFYTNPGFSIRGIARAFFVNLFAGRVVEGGSTITQELAKNAFLSSSRNYLRKYQELVLAAELNRRFSKEDILEMYLNSVYFGEGAFGIENAAQAYFSKNAEDLTLSESALLIGLLPAPSALSPLSNDPEFALKKRSIVLSEMVEENFITPSQKETAESEDPEFNPTAQTDDNTLAPHFALLVKDELIKKYGEERVIRDGFQVKTTLNNEWQVFAQNAVRNQVLALARNKAGNGAAVAMDPKNGEILVMVGSFDWDDEENGKINMAVRPRQPGSSFKPFMYAEAFEKKIITPATILNDTKTTFPGNYTPQNYDKRTRGQVTTRRALANSLNIPAVEVMEKLGVPDGLSAADRFGIKTLGMDASQYGLSLVLGTGEVKLIDLTGAYAVFANAGTYHKPKIVIEIKDKYGKPVDSKGFFSFLNVFSDPDSSKAISPEAAYLITHILSDNKARAEVFGSALTIGRTAAVKTGTTEDYRDALTVGFTPSLVVGVWIGNNDNTPMDNVAGSLGAAPIWRSLMTNFLSDVKVESFKKPSFVVSSVVCPPRQEPYMEYFIAGTEPKDCTSLTPTVSPTPPTSPTPSPSGTPAPTPTNEPEPTDEPEPTEESNPTSSIPLPTIEVTIP